MDSLYFIKDENRICQGDIFNNIEIKITIQTDNNLEIRDITFPYIVVLTQDCDLSEDYLCREGLRKTGESQDKYLQSILICPLFLAEDFRSGNHLSMIDLKMQHQNSGLWGTIINNKNERYHHFNIDRKNQIDELVADFKFYYTIPRNNLYKDADINYKISINKLFRESLSQRFAYYLSRIGLPELECDIMKKAI